MRLHDAAHGVAEVLVLGKALRRAGEDALGDLRLAAQQREVPEVLRRAGRALPRETVAVDDLAALHPRAREAEERVAPDRGAVRPELGLGLRQRVDGLVDPARVPVDEAHGVGRPRDLRGIVHARREACRGLGRERRVDVIRRVRQQVRELALHPRLHEVARPAVGSARERVERAAGTHERLGDLVLRGEHDRFAEQHLSEEVRVERCLVLGNPVVALRVLAPDQVIGEVEQVDRDARLHERVPDVRVHVRQLGPREIERLEVLEAARAQDAPLDALPAAREVGQQSLGVATGERGQSLLADGRHICITPRLGVG